MELWPACYRVPGKPVSRENLNLLGCVVFLVRLGAKAHELVQNSRDRLHFCYLSWD